MYKDPFYRFINNPAKQVVRIFFIIFAVLKLPFDMMIGAFKRSK